MTLLAAASEDTDSDYDGQAGFTRAKTDELARSVFQGFEETTRKRQVSVTSACVTNTPLSDELYSWVGSHTRTARTAAR